MLPFLLLACISCGSREQQDLCGRYFGPYPDLVSSRAAMGTAHRTYHNAMNLYSEGSYDVAADSLRVYMERRGFEKSAHLYMAMCLLAMDLPYDAELQLDHLENSRVKEFRDQTEWYTLLCWVCSDQRDRALAEAQRIAGMARHTYKKEAAALAQELGR